MFVTKQQQQQQQQQLYFALIQIIRNKKENKKQKWNFYRKAGGKVEKKIELRKVDELIIMIRKEQTLTFKLIPCTA